MTPEQFTYWLQGFMETADPKSIDEKQTQIIKDHLALVFTKVTPIYKPVDTNDLLKKFNENDFKIDWTYRPGQTLC